MAVLAVLCGSFAATAHAEFIEYYRYTVDEQGDTSVVVIASFDTTAMQLRGEVQRSPLGTAVEISDLVNVGGGVLTGSVLVTVTGQPDQFITLKSTLEFWPLHGAAHRDTVDMSADIPVSETPATPASGLIQEFFKIDLALSTSLDPRTQEKLQSLELTGEADLGNQAKLRIGDCVTITDGDVSTKQWYEIDLTGRFGYFNLGGTLTGTIDHQGAYSFIWTGTLSVSDEEWGAGVRARAESTSGGEIEGAFGVYGWMNVVPGVALTWFMENQVRQGSCEFASGVGLECELLTVLEFLHSVWTGTVGSWTSGELHRQEYLSSGREGAIRVNEFGTPSMLDVACQSTFCWPDTMSCIGQLPLQDQSSVETCQLTGAYYRCAFQDNDPNSFSESVSLTWQGEPGGYGRDKRPRFREEPRDVAADAGERRPEGRYLCTSPNPFNGDARISFEHPLDEQVTVDVYDVSGRRVRRLASEVFPAGTGVVVWDGRDDHGRPVSAGMYFVSLSGAGWKATGRALLLK